MPLTLSPLPYNIDGFPLARIADDMVATGAWRIDEAGVNSYNEKMPAFSLVWSALVQLGGLHPLRDLQWALPLVTSASAVAGYLLGAKLARHRGVGLAAGVFLAAFGSFLFLTSAIMKESLGLVVLPILVLLFHERRDPRKRGLALLLLLVLPFLHHLTTLIALGIVSSMLVLDHRQRWAARRFSPRRLATDLATGPAAGVPAVAYYMSVDLPFFRDVTRPDDVALFLALTVLLALLLARASRPARVREGRRIAAPSARVFIVPAIAFGGLLVNARTSVFAGANATQPLLLLVVVPAFLVLATFVVIGYPILRRTRNRANDVVLSILAAPTGLILFGFLRGLDPFSLAIVYRAFDYMDFGLAVLAGIGLAVLASGRRRWLVAPPAAALFVAALVATTPLAWDTQAALGVENVTTPHEFEALRFVASLGATNVTSDQRLSDVAEWWFGILGDPSLPVKLRDNETVEGPGYALVLERWTSVGAQIHPAPNVLLEPSALDAFLAAHRVLYAGGPPGERAFVVQLG